MYYCYILHSINPSFPNRTYIGMTNNPDKRLHQHNNTKQGAKSTRIIRPLEFMCIIGTFENKIEALKFEWLLKHPERKKYSNKYSGVNGKIKTLSYLFSDDKYSNLNIWINDKYTSLLDKTKSLNLNF
jgi:predicted GIY-YIG superfamily endonuclease